MRTTLPGAAMGTFVWDVHDHSTSGLITSGSFPVLATVAPAGSVFRRFQLRNCLFLATSNGSPEDSLSLFSWSHLVSVFTEHTGLRKIYTSARGFQTQGFGYYNTVFDSVNNSLMIGAGDPEIGFNQKTAYGREQDTVAPYVEYQGSLFGGASLGLSDLSGYVQFEFAVLYETFP